VFGIGGDRDDKTSARARRAEADAMIKAMARQDAQRLYINEVEEYLNDTHVAIAGLRDTIAALKAHAAARNGQFDTRGRL
jgi:hypothetical protein